MLEFFVSPLKVCPPLKVSIISGAALRGHILTKEI
jgi:hypothetical protein